MKCLSRVELQEFIDREIEPSLMARISDHIEKCKNCSSLYSKALRETGVINKLLGTPSDEMMPIPEFRPTALVRRRSLIYSLIPATAVAAALVLIFLFPLKHETTPENIPEAEILLYEYYDGKDLNRMWHEKSQIIILQDENGNVIQSIITN